MPGGAHGRPGGQLQPVHLVGGAVPRPRAALLGLQCLGAPPGGGESLLRLLRLLWPCYSVAFARIFEPFPHSRRRFAPVQEATGWQERVKARIKDYAVPDFIEHSGGPQA